jgi:hypothetical protein
MAVRWPCDCLAQGIQIAESIAACVNYAAQRLHRHTVVAAAQRSAKTDWRYRLATACRVHAAYNVPATTNRAAVRQPPAAHSRMAMCTIIGDWASEVRRHGMADHGSRTQSLQEASLLGRSHRQPCRTPTSQWVTPESAMATVRPREALPSTSAFRRIRERAEPSVRSGTASQRAQRRGPHSTRPTVPRTAGARPPAHRPSPAALRGGAAPATHAPAQ